MAKLKHNFVTAAKDYGLKRIFLSVSFIGSILLATGFGTFAIRRDLPASFFINVAGSIQGMAIGLFAILFAGFAIIVSLSDENFVKFLQKKKVFVRLLFPFWFDSALYLLATLSSFLSLWFDGLGQKFAVTFSTWIMLWALLDTFYLVMSTVLFGYYRAEFIEYRKEIEELLAKDDQPEQK
jgi:hypothetical protein